MSAGILQDPFKGVVVTNVLYNYLTGIENY
jgi:hypothetical protein